MAEPPHDRESDVDRAAILARRALLLCTLTACSAPRTRVADPPSAAPPDASLALDARADAPPARGVQLPDAALLLPEGATDTSPALATGWTRTPSGRRVYVVPAACLTVGEPDRLGIEVRAHEGASTAGVEVTVTSVRAAESAGVLPVAVFEARVRRALEPVRACFASSMRSAGVAEVRARLGADGFVGPVEVRTELPDPMRACVERAVATAGVEGVVTAPVDVAFDLHFERL